jgi:hypothetical protein
VVAFDMRTPPRLYLRLPDAVGAPKDAAAEGAEVGAESEEDPT